MSLVLTCDLALRMAPCGTFVLPVNVTPQFGAGVPVSLLMEPSLRERSRGPSSSRKLFMMAPDRASRIRKINSFAISLRVITAPDIVKKNSYP